MEFFLCFNNDWMPEELVNLDWVDSTSRVTLTGHFGIIWRDLVNNPWIFVFRKMIHICWRANERPTSLKAYTMITQHGQWAPMILVLWFYFDFNYFQWGFTRSIGQYLPIYHLWRYDNVLYARLENQCGLVNVKLKSIS